jgi:hypothetical protein
VLRPYAADGIDVTLRLGTANRTFDIALIDDQGRLVVAECKRTTARVKLADLDAFAYRVELLRRETDREVAGYYFVKSNYQLGVLKAAGDAGIRVAVASDEQGPRVHALVFQKHSPEREKRIREGHVFIDAELRPTGSLGIVVVRRDGSRDDKGLV